MRDKLIELIVDVENDLFRQRNNYSDSERIEKTVDYLISHGVAFAGDNNVGGRWIPVSERLPDRTTFVLAYITAVGRSYVGVRGYVEEGKNFKMNVGETVTHWMSLPAAPKEGE